MGKTAVTGLAVGLEKEHMVEQVLGKRPTVGAEVGEMELEPHRGPQVAAMEMDGNRR